MATKTALKQIRGDTRRYKFQRLNADGTPITIRPDKIYFTVKKSYSDNVVMLQKTIDDMTIDDDGTYHFTVEPDDTNNLQYMTYVFDIEVITDGVKTTIAKGGFTIQEEVTWAEDEV